MTTARRLGETAIGILPIAAILVLWHALAVFFATPAALLMRRSPLVAWAETIREIAAVGTT